MLEDEDLDFVEEEITPLDYVDSRMKTLGQSLNLLDPDGTFKGVPSEETLTKIMQAVREDYRELSRAIIALREDREGEEITLGFAEQHDGKLDEKGEYKAFLRENGLDGQRVYVAAGNDTYIYAMFTPKQALSLLDWLRQEEETLKSLAKEQV